MKINKEWHQEHKMPEKATFEERVKWHMEHQKTVNVLQFQKSYSKRWLRKG